LSIANIAIKGGKVKKCPNPYSGRAMINCDSNEFEKNMFSFPIAFLSFEPEKNGPFTFSPISLPQSYLQNPVLFGLITNPLLIYGIRHVFRVIFG
jgi:hypothetical protein